MSRPLTVLLLGLWLGMLLASWVVATINFRTVDRVLGPGSGTDLVKALVLAAEAWVFIRRPGV